MWEFIRKIFSEREGDVTVVVLDDQNPDTSSSFKLAATDIVRMTIIVVLVSVLITTVIFFTTPLGSLYQQRQDESLRQNVIKISERVVALQDSLYARDNQLRDMQQVLRSASDTLFPVQDIQRNGMVGNQNNRSFGRGVDIQAFDMLSKNEVIFSEHLERTPDFPANMPIRGTVSQGYVPEQGHYGLDIAAQPGTTFYALADGAVMYTDWTINYGYVLYLQHTDGIISVYKHGSKILKQQGDYVLKGDILGEVDDRGVLSSGSHLHLEIWRNGVPQNPLMYLIN